METLRQQFPRESTLIAEVFPEFWAEIFRLIEQGEGEKMAPTPEGTDLTSGEAGDAEPRERESDQLLDTEGETAVREEPTETGESVQGRAASASKAGLMETGGKGAMEPEIPVEDKEVEEFLEQLESELATGKLDWNVGELALRTSRRKEEPEELSPALRSPTSPYYKGPPPPPRQRRSPPKTLEEDRERDRRIQTRLDQLSDLMALSRPDPSACWNCGSKDHMMAACPQPWTRRFCYGCGRVGYILRDCPLCEDEYRIFGRNRLPHKKGE